MGLSKQYTVSMTTTAQDMANSLLDLAEEYEVDMSDLTIDNFSTLLDDLFQDGGHIRCVHFTDLAWEYSFQFGKLESEDFLDAQWRAIKRAIKLVQASYQ